MSSILILSCNDSNIDNANESLPDILFVQDVENGKISRLKTDLAFKGVQFENSAILYDPEKFTQLSSTNTAELQSLDLQDWTTEKVIHLVLPRLASNSEIKNALSAADLQIVTSRAKYDALSALLKPREFEEEKPLFIKGADSYTLVQDSLVRIELACKEVEEVLLEEPKEEKRSWCIAFLSLVRDFFRVLVFKILAKFIMAFIF